MMADTYMQPHLHPAAEKIERISLVEGRIAVLYFDEGGKVKDVTVLDKGRCDYVDVPAFTWHTYVMLTDSAITCETMMGRYEPATWKDFAAWAPREGTPEAAAYLDDLKSQCKAHASPR
jgi:cupin fold WbuC family metalloprotein